LGAALPRSGGITDIRNHPFFGRFDFNRSQNPDAEGLLNLTIRFEMSIFGAVMNYAIKKRYVPASQRFDERPKLKSMRRDGTELLEGPVDSKFFEVSVDTAGPGQKVFSAVHTSRAKMSLEPF
jgi:hypothetical protein